MVTLIKDFKKNYYQKFAEVSRLVAEASKKTSTDDIPEDVAVKDNGLRPNAIIVDDPQEKPSNISTDIDDGNIDYPSDFVDPHGNLYPDNTKGQDE